MRSLFAAAQNNDKVCIIICNLYTTCKFIIFYAEVYIVCFEFPEIHSAPAISRCMLAIWLQQKRHVLYILQSPAYRFSDSEDCHILLVLFLATRRDSWERLML